MKTLSVKRSFTIKEDIDQTLKRFANKSEVVNAALSIYFERAEFLESAENDFWKEKIESGLLDIKNHRVKTLNPNGEQVTRKELSKALWD
jgi:Arc/MetJ-type ribon-helix-helix transcriptional regulator